VQFVAEDPEASGGITKALGDLGGGESFDEEGAEGFVLPVDGVAGLEEEAAEVC